MDRPWPRVVPLLNRQGKAKSKWREVKAALAQRFERACCVDYPESTAPYTTVWGRRGAETKVVLAEAGFERGQAA